MTLTLSLPSDFVVVTCCRCNVTFAMNREFYQRTHETGANWYCLNGHLLHWLGLSTEEQLKAAQARQQHLEDQLLSSEREKDQQRAKLLRQQYRFANGVCPCCNRTFSNVAAHMQSQHPDFGPKPKLSPKAKAYTCSCGRKFGTPKGLRIHQTHSRPRDWANPKTPKWRRHLTEVMA